MASGTNGGPSSDTTVDVETSGGDAVKITVSPPEGPEVINLNEAFQSDKRNLSVTNRSNITNASEDDGDNGRWTLQEFKKYFIKKGGQRSDKLLKKLMKYEKNLNELLIVEDKTSTTFLHHTIEANYFKLFKVLVSYISVTDSSLIDITDSSKRTALHIAVGKDYSFTQLLVDSSANVNAQDVNGDTPLHILARLTTFDEKDPKNLIKCAEILSYSPNLDEKVTNIRGETPINSLKINKELDSAVSVKFEQVLNDSKTRTFWKAVQSCNVDEVEKLLSNGMNPNLKNPTTDLLPLHYALQKGSFALSNLLIENMKKTEKNGKKLTDLAEDSFSLLSTVLKIRYTSDADSNEHIKCLERLFKSDVSIKVNEEGVDTDNGNDTTALQIAASTNNQEGMKILLQNGAYLLQPKIVNGYYEGTVFDTIESGTLSNVMDSFVTCQGDAYYRLDYRFIVPPSDVHVRSVPISSTPVYFLKHPIMLTLLEAKWKSVSLSFILNFFANLLFHSSFFAYLLYRNIIELKCEINDQSNVTVNGTNVIVNGTNGTVHGNSDYNCYDESTENNKLGWIIVSGTAMIPFFFYFVFREICLLIVVRRKYFVNFQHQLQIIIGIIISILAYSDIDVQQRQHLSAWALIIASLDFLLIMGSTEAFAVPITMFRFVSRKILKYFFFFLFPLCSFIIGFFFLSMPNPGESLAEDPEKVIANFITDMFGMAAGGFDLYSNKVQDTTDSILSMFSFVLLFILFFFIVFLVQMNLMTGVAVADVKEFSDDTDYHFIKSRWRRIEQFEAYLPLWEMIEQCVPFESAKNFFKKKIKYLTRPSPENDYMILRYEENMNKLRRLTLASIKRKLFMSSKDILNYQLATSLRAIYLKNLRKKNVSSSNCSSVEIMTPQQTSEKTILKTLQNLEKSIEDIQERLKNHEKMSQQPIV